MKQFYKRNLLIGFLLLLSFQLQAADYYWVGGAGSWTDINHWSTTSGGVANKSIVPGTGDDVYFDANSSLPDNAAVTMPTSGHAYCRNMSWAGVTTRAIFRNLNTFQLMVYGSLELSSTVRYDTRDITFSGNSNATLKMNGAGYFLAASNSHNNLIINKPGGSLTMLDGIPAALVVWDLTLVEGHLDMSDNTHTFLNFNGVFPSIRSLDISNATLNVTGDWNFSNATGTLDATGSYIIAQTFNSDRHTFPKVDITGASLTQAISNTTFGALTFTNPLAPTGSGRIVGNNIIDRLEFKGGGRIASGGNIINKLILGPGKGYLFHGNNTINELMQLNTTDCDALGELSGADLNAKLTFGAGAVADIRNVYIKSLTAAGSITPISVIGADGGNNNGWNIQPRPSGTTLYWVGGAGNWDDRAHWSTSSGGTSGACVPFTGDNVVFDANSGFTTGSKTVSFTGNAWCHNMTWTGVAAAPVFSQPTTYQLEVWGSIVLDPTMTLNGNLVLRGNEVSTLTTNGCATGTATINVSKESVAGGLTIMDDINFPGLSFLHTRGNLTMVGRNINMYLFNSTSGLGRIIDISNSTILVTYWNLGATNVTWLNNAAGSFITSNRGFTANGLTYSRVYCNTILDEVNIQNTTINELVMTSTSPTSSLIALNGGNVIGTLDIRCGGAQLRGNNTITNLWLTPSRTYYLSNTQTINGLLRFDNPVCSGLGELKGVQGTAATLNFSPSATRDFNNVYLQNLTATGSGVPITVAGADAGGNTGFNITASGSGPRYWVGGAGNWNESMHWSTISGGPGGACVPTVANDVYFDASSFTSGSSTVTISQGNAYCRNMDWTGAAFAPVFTKASNVLVMEIWGNVTLNTTVSINAQLFFTGSANSTFTSNGNTLGNLDMFVNKSVGYSLRFMDNFSNPLTRIDLRYGGLDISGRTLTLDAISDGNQNGPTSINMTNATVNAAAWEYQGANKSLQATGSIINTSGYFAADDAVYNKVTTGATVASSIRIASISATDFVFTNPASTSGAYIQGGNTIDRLEFKGKGLINGTGNTIGTMIFAPGMTYTFLAGSNTTITNAWFGSGTPCNPTQIVSSSTTNATVTKSTGTVDFDYIRLNHITAAGVTPFKAGEHSTDLGGNVNWAIAPYNGTATIVGLGPDKLLLASEFPYTIRTDGFFASPLAQSQWKKSGTVVGTGSELVITTPGTYTVNVTYPDGCGSTDQIVITQAVSDVSVANTVDKPAPAFGSEVVFTVVATNNGPQQSGGITVTDLLPAGYTFKSAAPQTGTYNPGTGVWTIGNLANEASSTLTITAVVKATGPYETTATIAGPEVDGVANNSSNATTTPFAATLSIVKTTDAAEPAANGSFTISLPTGVTVSEDITVAYNVTGTATAGTDYTTIPVTAVLLAGQNSITLPVTAINETLIESTETVIVTLTAGTSTNFTFAASTTNAAATVNIADDDSTPANRTISVTPLVATVTEPASTRYVISLPTGITAAENITVTYTMGGTATSGLDYQPLSGTAVILAGTNTVEVIENTLDDALLEATETAIMTLSDATTATLGNFVVSTTAGTLNIADDDNGNAANRVLSITKTTDAAEPATNGGFKISLPTGLVSSSDVTVAYTIDASSTATSTTDYQAISSIIIPAGQNSVTVPVNVVDNTIIEPSETVIMNISGGSDGSNTYTANAGANSATVNITDNDFAGNSNIVLLTKVSDAIEGGALGQYRVSLPPGVTSSQDVVVTFNTTGNAIRPTDYSLLNLTAGNIVIPAGANEVLVNVDAVTDAVIEGPETVVLNLTGATSGGLPFTIDATSNGAVVSIVDANTSSTTPLEVIADTNPTEAAPNGNFIVRLTGGNLSALPVTVGYSVSGTATQGVDYQSFGTLVIPANTNSINVPLTVIDDQIIELPENMTFTILSGSATNGTTAFTFPPDGINGALTVTIADNDAGAGSRVLSMVKTTDAAEPATNGSFTVSLPAGYVSAAPITLNIARSGTAINVVDYAAANTITLPAYSNSVTIPVNVATDNVIEPTETVIFTLNNTTDGNAFTYTPSGTNGAATMNITDGNASSRLIRIATTTPTISEATGSGSINISLPPGVITSEDITVSYALGGTAVGSDYTGLTGTATIPAGSNSAPTINFTAVNDQIIEKNETIIATITGGTTLSGNTFTADPAQNSATITINDDDNTPANRTVKVTVFRDGAEGGLSNRFNFLFPAGITSSETVTIHYTVGGTAARGIDYTGLTQTHYSGTATISAGSTNTATTGNVVDDQIIEGDETIVITITDASSGSFTFTPDVTEGTATANIADNDDIPANLVLSIAKTLDGAEPATNGTFKISLPGTLSAAKDITVNYGVSGTATAGTDYTALSGNLTILAGQNSATLTVPVLNDAVYDDLETVIVTLSGGTAPGLPAFTASSTAGSATVNITDDEPVPPTILSFTPPGGVAGTTVTITGTNFTGATSVTFNGLEAASYTVNSATEITAIVAFGTSTGLITVTTPAGIATSATNFTILNTAPVAGPDSYTVSINTPYVGNVLINDSDPEGDVLNASLVTAPAHGTIVLHADGSFTYTPDADYIGPDTFSYQACDNGTVSLCATAAVALDIQNTLSPNMINVTSSNADGVYKPGDIITILTTFDQDVTVNTLGGLPGMELELGIPGRNAAYVSGSGSSELMFSYTVQAGDGTPDLGYIPSSSLALNGATIRNAFNIDASLTLPDGPNSLRENKDLVIDGQPAVIISVAVPASKTYGSGQNLDFMVNYSEAVNVNTAGGTPRIAITLDNGGTVYASYISGSGTAAHIYRFTVTSGQEDLNGITLGGSLLLNGAIQQDLSDNTVDLVLNNIASTAAVLVDAIAPTTVSINRADPNPATTSTVTYTVTFSEGMTGVDAADFTLVPTGTVTGTLESVTAVNANTYTVTVNGVSGSGTLGMNLKAGGTGITDIAANAISGGFSGEIYTIDADLPLITNVSSTTANGTYKTGDVINVAISFSKNVIVSGIPQLALNSGGTANYVSGSGTAALNFTYTVAAGNSSSDLDYTAVTSLTLTGGTIRDAASHDALLSLPLPGSAGSLGANKDIVIDAVVPPVVPPVPTDIGLSVQIIPENQAAGSGIGQLTSVSANPGGTYTYTLVSGAGSTDNALFTIVGNQLKAAVPFNFETKNSYTIRVRTTSDQNQTVEKSFTITVSDVNEAPALGTVPNQVLCYTPEVRTVMLSGINAGPEAAQNVTVSVTSSNASLFDQLSVAPVTDGNSVLSYRLAKNVSGTADITVTVTDNGATDNGGVNTVSQSFSLNVSALAQLSITSSAPTNTISKGTTIELTATGAASYSWADASGIISGQNSSVLKVRPAQTTTYTVTSGNGTCTSTQSVVITVLEDNKLVANNVLTPNGDGINDVLAISNIDMYPNNELRIFDRSGRILYTKKGYNNEWDGKVNGIALHEDTYYYIIDFGNGKSLRKGFVSIIRRQ